MAKVFITDRTPYRSDAKAPLSFEDNVVVIPGHVIDELELQPEGSEVLAVLDGLKAKGDLSKGVATPNGGVVIVDNRINRPNDLALRPMTNDNILIGVALKWRDLLRSKRQQPQKPHQRSNRAFDATENIIQHFSLSEVCVISKRPSLRLKASSYGIPADDYRHNKMVQSPSEISSGMVTIPVNPNNFSELCRLICESGAAGTTREVLNGLIITPELYPNACCVFEAEGKSILAIHKSDDDHPPRFVHVPKPKPQPQMADGIQPRNIGQAFELALLRDPSIKLVALSGAAGSGKTLLPLLAGLEAIRDGENSQLLVYRPNIELGKELGFLPGDLDEKFAPWMKPVFDQFKLMNKTESKSKDAKKNSFNINGLLKEGRISIEPINFIQGRTLQDEYVLVDEAQNLTPEQITMVATRAGERAKIVLGGCVTQVANKEILDMGNNGITYMIKVMHGDSLFGHITLEKSVRSLLSQRVVERTQSQ